MANAFTYKENIYHVGDKVAVHQRIEEEGKVRTQVFEGLIIGVKGRDVNKSFTIRKIATGNIGVERIFPLGTPLIDKIELKSQGDVRRSKLYYLRSRTGRQALRVKTISTQ